MAIYHLSTKPVSRGMGRSATAAAAYRAGELVHDQVFDYSRKRGIEHTEIVLPTAASKADINWARDRQALWNAATMPNQSTMTSAGHLEKFHRITFARIAYAGISISK